MTIINGRNRHLFIDGAVIVPDHGGADCITGFSNEEAVELFLEWLANERDYQNQERQKKARAEEAQERRKKIYAVSNHPPDG